MTIASIRSVNYYFSFRFGLKGLYSPCLECYIYYVAGAAVSLLAIALMSDLIFKKSKKWVPCLFWVSVSTLYQFVLFVYSLF
jgi:hypothetical protein